MLLPGQPAGQGRENAPCLKWVTRTTKLTLSAMSPLSPLKADLAADIDLRRYGPETDYLALQIFAKKFAAR